MTVKKLVYGVGINDADYVAEQKKTIIINGVQKEKLVWYCPYYRTWKSILERCFSTKFQERNPAYKGCSVSDEWLTLSNFKSWMEEQDFERKQLDKDLLVEGNKVYSEDTCVFVTQVVNTFTTDCRAARGEWLVGWCELEQRC